MIEVFMEITGRNCPENIIFKDCTYRKSAISLSASDIATFRIRIEIAGKLAI